MKLKEFIDGVLKREGSAYTNNPNDSGGPTKYGITQRTLSSYRGRPCSAMDVANLTEAEARQIYEAEYWTKPGFGDVAKVSLAVAEELLDTGVNAGPSRAALMFQRALNGLNKRGEHYPDIAEDGDIGPGTVSAFAKLIQRRGKDGEVVMLRYLNGLQVAMYDDLVRRRPKDEDFMFGWLLNRVQ